MVKSGHKKGSKTMKKKFSPKDKAAIALEAIKEVKTTAQVASQYEVHPIQVGVWKKQLIKNAAKVFSEKSDKEDLQKEIDESHRIIGQRDVELAWLKKKLEPFKSP